MPTYFICEDAEALQSEMHFSVLPLLDAKQYRMPGQLSQLEKYALLSTP